MLRLPASRVSPTWKIFDGSACSVSVAAVWAGVGAAVWAGGWDFDCYADGVACDRFLWSSDDSLSQSSISPGRKLQGYVCFEVPESAEAVELEYETSFWTQDKVIFVVE